MTSDNGGLRPRRVLVVEDDDDSRDLLGELIATFGHNAIGARNAVDALRHVSTMPLDVALIDIGLPDMDGFEVARRVRATLGSTPIRLIALTGYSDRDTRAIASEAGFDEFLIKPFSPEALQELLESTPIRA